jgi:flagellar biosynthetic protein FliP
MNPTLTTMYSSAYEPWSKGEIDQTQAVDRAVGPLKQFMLKSTREKDLQLFVDMSGGRNRRVRKTCPCGSLCRHS